MSDDGFRVVSGKRAIRRKRINDQSRQQLTTDLDEKTEYDKHIIEKNLPSYRLELLDSDFMQAVNGILIKSGIVKHGFMKQGQSTEDVSGACNLSDFNKSRTADCSERTAGLVDVAPVNQLICYGIGSIVSSIIARYQLTFLLILRENLKVSPDQCYIYDPVLYKTDHDIIRQLNFNIFMKNEEARRRVEERTLFYMPHCGKALYNNLIWSNWCPEHLHNVIILGNSFSQMQVSTPERFLKEEGAYILKILPYVQEFPVPNIFKHADIFNDTSLHVINRSKLATVSQEFWEKCPRPVYGSGADDIIFDS